MSHLDDCPHCAEENGLEAIKGLSAEHSGELMRAFDRMVADKLITDAQVAEVIVMLGHYAFKIVRTGSKEDRGVATYTVGDVLQAMKAQTFDVPARRVG
jgi:hypothetical protein